MQKPGTLFISMFMAGALAFSSAAAADEIDRQKLHEQAQSLFAPLPETVDNPDNPLSDVKVELGKMLFYDPRLSESGFISCRSEEHTSELQSRGHLVCR